jgi:15-cis-phytoene desaturase
MMLVTALLLVAQGRMVQDALTGAPGGLLQKLLGQRAEGFQAPARAFSSARLPGRAEHSQPSLLRTAAQGPTAPSVASITSSTPPTRVTWRRSEEAVMKDFPKPKQLENTIPYEEANALSKKFQQKAWRTAETGAKKKVAIIGGGLSGMSAAKYLADAGHEPLVLEARDVLGGKVSAWQDEDGDWIETGLHIFFGAYPNMMNIFAELGIEDRLQWKVHKMIFAMQELPGEFTSFDFVAGIPAPFNFGLAILLNQKMLSLGEKLQTAPPLLPMLIEGQEFIDAQDELSVLDFMRKYGMPDRINEEVFISMAKALDFIDPDKLSMTVVLTAMNRFLNEDDGLQMAFLDGNQPERLLAPMKNHVEARGGEVKTSVPVEEILTNEDGSVAGLKMRDGSTVTADYYISSMPVDVMKRMVPERWQKEPYFRQFDELEGIPVINLHLWFDKQLDSVDHLCFSRSPLLSVYADMSVTCKEYASNEGSMLELVFAPCSPLAGGDTNWIAKKDEEIIDATMGELARLFPTEIANDPKWPSTAKQSPAGQARLRKYAVVKVPRSVYAAIPGRNKFRPSQETPIDNLVLAGDWTSQKFLGSMEGAILGGKLAAEVVVDKALGEQTKGIKEIQPECVAKAAAHEPKAPVGVRGDSAIAFGGGMQLTDKGRDLLRDQDAIQLKGEESESEELVGA